MMTMKMLRLWNDMLMADGCYADDSLYTGVGLTLPTMVPILRCANMWTPGVEVA